MTRKRRTLMYCACEFWCGDPYITGENALKDARQVAQMLEERKITDRGVEQAIIWVACKMLSNTRTLPPHEAIRRAFRLYDATEEDEDGETER